MARGPSGCAVGEATVSILLKKGAEASLYLADWQGKRVIIKQRLPKKYRPEQLDQRIRHYRTVHEPQLMHEAKRAGVPTPIIFLVDVENSTIIMEYIEGQQVKQLLDVLCESERRALCKKIGAEIAKLHAYGVVHGDLTTSNMILSSEGRVFFVDFGLGDKSIELEAKGVDLHLLRRALQSTHFQVAEECFSWVLKGYGQVLGSDAKATILEKVKEIEKRGRYVGERQQEK
jgi:TP53 regulating kinase-like protein